MLPKPEKRSRREIVSQQLELDSVSSGKNELRHKRYLIGVLLVITIGSSVTLWAYQLFRQPFTLPALKFSLPRLDFHLTTPDTTLESSLKTLKNDPTFSVLVALQGSSSPTYSINIADSVVISQNFDKLGSAPATSRFASSLPAGVDVRETATGDGHYFQISNPLRTINLYLRYPPDLSTDKLTQIVKDVYWSFNRAN